MQTPLHYAVKSLNQPAVRALVEQDADIDSVDSFGHSPLNMSQGSRSLVKILAGTPSKVTTVASATEIFEECPFHIANRSMGFVIQARDKHGRVRPRGGNVFDVNVTHMNVKQSDAQIDHKLIDLKNGQYQVIWRTDTPGTYKVSVQWQGEEIKGSPLTTTVIPPDTDGYDDKLVSGGSSTVRIQLPPHISRAKSTALELAPIHSPFILLTHYYVHRDG